MDSAAGVPSNRMVSFGEGLGLAFKNYANFNGRTSRGGYWWYTLWIVLISIVAAVIDMLAFGDITRSLDGSGPIQIMLSLGTLLPSLGIGVRRLHDIGKSGWWILIALTIIGIFLLLYWDCQPGQRKENSFGPDTEAGR